MADGSSGQRPREVKTVVEDAKALTTVLAMEAESVLGRRAARALGVLAICAIGVVVLSLLLNGYINPTKPDERKDLVLALAQILGGAALLSGLYFTWRTLQVNREGQITERFTRAIDQLGSVSLEIRLGGIYALERIARDSERDHWPIMEVLTAYVRERAPGPLEEGQTRGDDGAKEKPEEDSNAEPASTDVPPPDPDVQAIMTVISRRTQYWGQGETELLDLRGIDLRGAYLRKANFVGADLSGANFSRAELRGADLRNANLVGANLSGANLVGADLRRATLWKADLRGADLVGADLRRVDLSGALHLTQEQVEHVRGDETTTLPNHLTPPAYWSVNSDEPPESG